MNCNVCWYHSFCWICYGWYLWQRSSSMTGPRHGLLEASLQLFWRYRHYRLVRNCREGPVQSIFDLVGMLRSSRSRSLASFGEWLSIWRNHRGRGDIFDVVMGERNHGAVVYQDYDESRRITRGVWGVCDGDAQLWQSSCLQTRFTAKVQECNDSSRYVCCENRQFATQSFCSRPSDTERSNSLSQLTDYLLVLCLM